MYSPSRPNSVPVKSSYSALVIIVLLLPLCSSATDYRNKSGGNWNDVNIWEEWTVNGWMQATSVPKDVNGDIYINVSGVSITSITDITMGTLHLKGFLYIDPAVFTFHGDVSIEVISHNYGGISGPGKMYVIGTLYAQAGNHNCSKPFIQI